MERPDLDTLTCVNTECPLFRQAGQSNLVIRKVYGRDGLSGSSREDFSSVSVCFVFPVSLANASYSVLRLMPKVRQTAALLAPFFRASRMPSIVSSLIAYGRPPRLPRLFAASSPAIMRSLVSARSYCASAPNTLKRNSPCGVVVSICSVRDRKATPRDCRIVVTRYPHIAHEHIRKTSFLWFPYKRSIRQGFPYGNWQSFRAK